MQNQMHLPGFGKMSERLARVLIYSGIGLLIFALGVGSVFGYRFIRLGLTRDLRERVAVKDTGKDIPLDILALIHSQTTFSVGQVLALIECESEGVIRAKSPKGALGIMQLMPVHANRAGLAVDDLWDPEVSVRLGVKHLLWLDKKYKGREYHVISAYNCGHGDWDKILAGKKSISRETANHWRKYRRAKRRLENWIDRAEWEE